jgi:protein PhnA
MGNQSASTGSGIEINEGGSGSLVDPIKDAFGTILTAGDSVSLTKDLKLKGSSQVIKVGTKVKNIQIVDDAVDGHNISCRIDGIGQLNLKSEFLKKI